MTQVITEIRWEPAGHRLRVFQVFKRPDSDLASVRIAWGVANPDTIQRLADKFGVKEVSRIVPNQERFSYNLDAAALKQRLTVWRSACKRDGLSNCQTLEGN